MPELVKAALTELSGDLKSPTFANRIEVQFNPTTLKLALANQTDGGKAPAMTRTSHQYLGSGTRTLTLDLVFDTADEGSSGHPRSVRERTAMVERFALPRANGSDKQAPPRVRFEWGKFRIDGVIDSVNIDFEHFAADGTPLRAKCSLSIKEQDARFILKETGAGANPAGSAPPPGGSGSGQPGTSGSGSLRVGVALGGESAADFTARMGLDPGAWRGLAAGLDATLSLSAGLEIGIGASLGTGLGIGVSAGLGAGVAASVSASFGLEADLSFGAGLTAEGQFGTQFGTQPGGTLGAGLTAAGQLGSPLGAGSSGAPPAAGFSLSAAGGVGAAIESVKSAQAQASQRAAKAAFADPSGTVSATAAAAGATTGSAAATGPLAPGGQASPIATPAAPGTATAPVRPGMPQQPRPPLTQTGLPAPGTRAAAAPPPPKADPRAVSFGLGVPLRSTFGEAARRRAQGDLGLPPTTDDPQVPRWQELPAQRPASGTAAGRAAQGQPAGNRCACPPAGTRKRV